MKLQISSIMFGLLCLLGPSKAIAQALPDPALVYGYYDTVQQHDVAYSVPVFAQYRNVTIQHQDTVTDQLSVQLNAPLPANTQDRLTIEAYYRTEDVRENRAIIFSYGSYTYASNPAITPGTAGIVRVSASNHDMIAGLTPVVIDDTVTFTYDNRLVNGNLPTWSSFAICLQMWIRVSHWAGCLLGIAVLKFLILHCQGKILPFPHTRKSQTPLSLSEFQT